MMIETKTISQSKYKYTTVNRLIFWECLAIRVNGII